jgi:hypothetical protein
MKTKVIVLLLSLITICAIARIVVPFQGWDRLKDSSPYIVIVQCGKPTSPVSNESIIGGTKSDSEIRVVAFLKGTNSMNSAHLQTDRQLWQGQYYLVFGYYEDGIYKAYEEYRAIHLGSDFSTNLIVGKSLDEQLLVLFKHSLFNLNRQLKEEQEEKQRLEEGIKR